jgi:mono/diheme cytochrome c family protein
MISLDNDVSSVTAGVGLGGGVKVKLIIGVAMAPAMLATAWALAATPPAPQKTPTSQAPKALPVKADADAAAPPSVTVTNKYCVGCHNARARIGGIAFDTLDRAQPGHDPAIWEEAIRRLRGHYMPPSSAKQPSEAERQQLITWLETQLDLSANKDLNPALVPLQRLNRREYANSIRDLIGLDIDPAEWLPQDPVKGDFDTDAASLQFTPNFLDQSLAAARALSLEAVGDPKAPPVDTTYGNIANMIISLPPRPTQGAGNQEKYEQGMPFGTRGGMVEEHVFPADGEYVLTIGDMALAREVPKMEFENTVIALLDGKEFYRTTIGGEADHKLIDQKLDDGVFQVNKRLRDIHFHATAGQHKIAVTFLRRSYAESDERVRPNTIDGGQQRVEAVHAFQIKGPVKVTGVSDSPSRQKIFICKPTSAADEDACAHKIVANLAERAFRRPVTDADLKPLMAFYDKGRKDEGTFDAGVRDSVAAILASPHFLYRAEAASDHTRQLSDLELATRLSFFLWSSVPDKELLTLAENNQLSKPGVLDAQVHRMLRDKRAKSLTTGFAFQWFNVAKLDQISPSQARFSYAAGVYDPRPMFKTELAMYVDSILRSDRSVVDLLTADYTYINEQIALLYGIEDIKGGGFRRVVLKDPKRRGLLGKGAILMLTANPNRTAPVLRGAWILDKVLGTPPNNPPLNVPALEETKTAKPTTVRGLVELHRKNPVCAGCHAVMDPLGFSLENFDTVGEFHTIDPQSRQPIDTAAVMPDGTKMAGPEDLAKVLASHGDQFASTITQKLMTYAVGRPVDYRDMPTVRRITRESAAKNYTFESIVLGVVKSDAFRKRAPSPLPKLITAQAESPKSN